MTGGQASVPVTVRAIVNRGGEQGAQHSQALHSWFAHVPGLRVVMPSSVSDASDLLISSVLCNDPVLFIDDRWLYDQTGSLSKAELTPLNKIQPKCLQEGADVTIVGVGYGTKCSLDASIELAKKGISAEVIDLIFLNQLNLKLVIDSVSKTRRVVVVDGLETL